MSNTLGKEKRDTKLAPPGLTLHADQHLQAAKPDRLRVRNTVTVDNVAFDALTSQGVVDTVAHGWAAGRGGLILTPNVDILRQLWQSGDYSIADRAEIVTPDGMPVVWAAKLQGTHLPERVTGVDLVDGISAKAATKGRSVFLLGAGPGVATRAAAALQDRHPGLRIAGTCSPPKGFNTDPRYMTELRAHLTDVAPDAVFCAFGFPKQEKLSLELLDDNPKTWFLGCGGAFDMICGDRQRAPKAVQGAGAEWLHRMMLEPRRMAHRYLVQDVPYVAGMMRRAIRNRKKQQR